MTATSNTPQPILDLSKAFRDCADALNDYADRAPDPLDPSLSTLRVTAAHLVNEASIIGQMQLATLAQDVAGAINGLQIQVNAAQRALATIQAVKNVVSVAAAVFSTAAAVASGNPLGAAQQVASLVSTIATTLHANA
jgi:hypothetical protein